MEKQHNRGQDGAGLATVKLNTEPGYPFLHRITKLSQPGDSRYLFTNRRTNQRDTKVPSGNRPAPWPDERPY